MYNLPEIFAMTVPIKRFNVNTIGQYHNLTNLPKPDHPLLSVIKFEDQAWAPGNYNIYMVHNFYTISQKKNTNRRCRYGQSEEIDSEERGLHFMSPKQVVIIEATDKEFTSSGWALLIHPDFLWNSSLAKKIKLYEYFKYEVNSGLPLSVAEENTIQDMIKNISEEQGNSHDTYNREVILAQIELLLAYCERIYRRLFAQRKKTEHSVLDKMENLISEYFKSQDLAKKGIPTVTYIADQLHISPNHLSRLLKNITGRSTKNYLNDKLLDLAKEKLSTTQLSVSEIAYELGFKFPQSFNKLFKARTNQTPLEFRQTFVSVS